MSGDDIPVRDGVQPANPVSGLDDDGLLAAVREMLGGSEEAPDWSVELAKGSYDLRAIDAELATLSSGSGLAPAGSGTRSDATMRVAVFDAADLSVEIEIEPGERAGSWRLVGQLNPAAPARIEVRQQQAESRWVDADRFGRFAVGDLRSGPLSLVCTRSGLRDVVTEWITIGQARGYGDPGRPGELPAMTAGETIGTLADELARVLLSGDPFSASLMSVPGYEDAVPDLSPDYQQAWRGRLVDVIARCAAAEAGPGDTASQVLLETTRDTAARELAAAESRVYEFSVTTFPLGGPSLVLLTGSRTSVSDPGSALAYLARCRQIPGYLDQHAARLRAAVRDGLRPVAPLVSDAIRQLRHHLSHPERDPLLAHRPPEGWAGAAAWRDDIEGVVRDEIRPALGRYAGLLAGLLPSSRQPDQAGLLYVPGGLTAYAACVRNGTTLPFDPDELHRLGLAALAEIEEQISELGRRAFGTADVGEITVRFRNAPEFTAPDGAAAMARAAAAIARAEERLPDMFRPPLPPSCAVDPMPSHMAEFGAPPYYSPPARDGSRPGAYLFNDVRPGHAGSWALEAMAFHEGVPGHHAQFARVQLVPGLPLLLSGFYVVPHGEGWGLYAERLADELGLYSDDVQRLGMLGSAAFRAVRLVVDTGLHARGWSRARAREFALAHSPMPEDFVDAEIDRYIALPGQALGYLTGQREILRLRDEARSRLGAAFDIRDFHSAVLDHGSLPLPVLRQVVADWTASAAT